MARLLYKILNPVADITGFGGGVGWTLSTGSDIYAILNYSDNLDHYVTATQNGRWFRIKMDGFTENHTKIQGIQACISAYRGGRSGTHDVTVDIENASNSNYYTTTHSVTVNDGQPATYCGTFRTTHNGSTEWNTTPSGAGNINDPLRMQITSNTNNSDRVFINAVYIIVTYEDTLTYSFSDNDVTINEGLTEIKNGLTTIK